MVFVREKRLCLTSDAERYAMSAKLTLSYSSPSIKQLDALVKRLEAGTYFGTGDSNEACPRFECGSETCLV